MLDLERRSDLRKSSNISLDGVVSCMYLSGAGSFGIGRVRESACEHLAWVLLLSLEDVS